MKLLTAPLPALTARAALALACAGLTALGCSREYALGDLSDRDLAIGAVEPARPVTPDLSLAAALPAPEVSFDRETAAWYFPIMSGVGDLDGDGYEEVATLGYDGGTQTEYVHVRYGGARPETSDQALAFAEGGVRLTVHVGNNLPMVQSLVPAGDIDGDGYGDMLANLGTCDPTMLGEGAYLLYGGPERLSGVQRFDTAGVYLASPRLLTGTGDGKSGSCGSDNQPHALGIGDFDGDGFDDIVLHDPQQLNLNDFPTISGSPDSSLYLFYGRKERLATGTSWLEADARLIAHQELLPAALGDVDADGRADLIVGSSTIFEQFPSTFYALRGRSERLEGDVDVASIAVPLPDWTSVPSSASLKGPDLDGDGTTDLILMNATDQQLYLFYGRAGLLDANLDVSQSAALLTDDLTGSIGVATAGDRDGDGDTDLLSLFSVDATLGWRVGFVGGARQRFSGSVVFPDQAVVDANPDGRLLEEYRWLEGVALAGDLDGDGASDLISASSLYFMTEEPGGFELQAPQLHIHYGVPASPLGPR